MVLRSVLQERACSLLLLSYRAFLFPNCGPPPLYPLAVFCLSSLRTRSRPTYWRFCCPARPGFFGCFFLAPGSFFVRSALCFASLTIDSRLIPPPLWGLRTSVFFRNQPATMPSFDYYLQECSFPLSLPPPSLSGVPPFSFPCNPLPPALPSGTTHLSEKVSFGLR